MRILIVLLAISISKFLFAQTIGTGFNKNMYTCIANGEVYNNGRNEGNLGNGELSHSNELVQAIGLTNVIKLDGGWQHSMALKEDGTVWTWGKNYSGQLGDGTTLPSTIPNQVPGLDEIIDISAGYNYCLALTKDGRIYAWGDNSFGQLGLGAHAVGSSVTSPALLSITDVTDIGAGVNHSLAVRNDGTLWAWGRGGNGQMGIIALSDQSEPVQVNGLTDIVEVAASRLASLALSSNGQVYAWGTNNNGIIGDTVSFLHTVPFTTSIGNAVDIDAGEYHCLFLLDDGTVMATGGNFYGQIGDGTDNNAYVPKRCGAITDIVQISAGGNQSMALKSDGTMYVWGSNQYGHALDNDSTTNSILKPIEFDNVCPEIPEDTAESVEFRIAPNPSNGLIIIKGEGFDEGLINVFNLEGRRLKSERPVGDYLDFRDLPSGVYILHVQMNDGWTAHKISIIK